MKVILNYMVRILSQCIHLRNHLSVHFKYLIILLVSYTSIQLRVGNKVILPSIYALHFQSEAFSTVAGWVKTAKYIPYKLAADTIHVFIQKSILSLYQFHFDNPFLLSTYMLPTI